MSRGWEAALMETSWSLLFKKMMLLDGSKKFEVASLVGFERESEVLFEGAMTAGKKN